MSCSIVHSDPCMENTLPSKRKPLANIVAAVDFSSASMTALHYALLLARQYGAKLYLTHIAGDAAGADHAWREGQRLTTDLLISGELRGIAHKLIVGQGEIWQGLAPIVKENNIDLIVVGTHGRTGIAKVLLGSVAERIFRQAHCPVLTVGPKSPEPMVGKGFSKLLYATDFTSQSLGAAEYAFSLAHQYQARLTLLHVIAQEPADANAKQAAIKEATARLKKITTPNLQSAAEPEYVVRFGSAGRAILSVAAERTPDLIVLGVTQPAEGAFAGRRWTNASEVTCEATCPVLTIRFVDASIDSQST
jgi:nucleotide-binding universal stress UspA family protein